MTDKTVHWAGIRETTFVWGIRILYGFFRLGGRPLFWLSLWPVVAVYWLMLPRVRAASLDYLKRAFAAGLLKRRPTVFTTLTHVFHFADTVLDKLLAVAGYFGKESLKVQGREPLLASGKGAVLVTAHTGCLELCQALTADPSRLYVLTHTRHAQEFNRMLARINPAFAVNHIEVTELTPAVAIELADKVASGAFLVIAGDRIPVASQAVTHAAFLGTAAPFPSGPALLSLLLKCPLWAMVCTRNSGGVGAKYHLTFKKLAAPENVGRRERNAYFARAAGAYAAFLTQELAREPLDWFNFFDFWHQAANDAHGVHAKRAEENP